MTADPGVPTWQARTHTSADTLCAEAAGHLHDLLLRDGAPPVDGDPLPLLWHWLAFLPSARQDELGPDGHPQPGDFLPPTRGRARMYAGGAIARGAEPARIGRQLRRSSTVTGVTTKSGRTGPLTFVEVKHALTDGGHTVLTERADLVYRDAQRYQRAPLPPTEPAAAWTCTRQVPIDPTLLFRFSALTYNAHRIHYDRDYATGVEGYPGLVVHGPLQAVLLADALDRALPARTVATFTFRGVAPAFDDHNLQLRVAADHTDTVQLAAYSADRLTMTATATLTPLAERNPR